MADRPLVTGLAVSTGGRVVSELGGSQISSLLETLPGIANVLRSPVADALVGVIKAASRSPEFRPADAEELIRYATRRGLMAQDEGDRLLEEIRTAHPEPAPRPAKPVTKPAAKAPAKPAARPAARPVRARAHPTKAAKPAKPRPKAAKPAKSGRAAKPVRAPKSASRAARSVKSVKPVKKAAKHARKR